MRITIVSTFRPGYDVALEACYARAFLGLGHQVSCVSLAPDVEPRAGLAGRLLARQHARAGQGALQRRVAETAPQLVVLVKAVGVLAESVETWRRDGVPTVNIFPDNPFEVMRVAPGGATLGEQLRACQLVFVHDRFAVGQLRMQGVAAEYLAFARDPALHDRRDAAGVERGGPSIVFVGNPDAERIRYLDAIADLDLGLWGAWGWAGLGPEAPLGRCIRGGQLEARDMTRQLASAALCINILRRSQKTAHNMRTFEAPASGTCVVSERSNGVLEHLREGVEVATFSTPGELRQVCLRLLADDGARAAIGDAGWRRVEHETYARRAAEILERLGS